MVAQRHLRQGLDFFQTVEQGLAVDVQLPGGQADVVIAVDELGQRAMRLMPDPTSYFCSRVNVSFAMATISSLLESAEITRAFCVS